MVDAKIETVWRNHLKLCDSITSQTGERVPVLAGQVGQVDVTSPNGYRYKMGFWDKVLSDSVILEKIQNRDILGMTEHPVDDSEYLKTPYDKASHVVLKAWVQDGNPYAQIGLLNNKQGNDIKALIDVGHKPGISTRGLGSVLTDSIGQYIPDKDYMFLTWDIVRNPNFGTLRMNTITDSLRRSPIFKELCEMHQLQDSVDESYNSDKLDVDMGKAIEALKILKEYLIR